MAAWVLLLFKRRSTWSQTRVAAARLIMLLIVVLVEWAASRRSAHVTFAGFVVLYFFLIRDSASLLTNLTWSLTVRWSIVGVLSRSHTQVAAALRIMVSRCS
jgi:hypothetical protein